MDADRCGLVRPEEWQPRFRRWREEAPDRVLVHAWSQYGGQEVLALTVLPPGGPRPGAPHLLAAVPHALEPAPTAAAVDLACQLVTGRHVDGSPADVPAGPGAVRLAVTLMPDANPQGRVRSPARCWDGRDCDNATFLRHAFGVAAGGGVFPRLPEWRWSEHSPRRAGLEFEQVDGDLWVEPNTSRRSTYSRGLDDLWELRPTHVVDMHQHQSAEAVLLPEDFDDRPPEGRAAIAAWGDAVLRAWREAGGAPQARPHLPYRGQPRQGQVRAFWGGRYGGPPG